MDTDHIGLYETEHQYSDRLRARGLHPVAARIRAWKEAMSRDIDAAPDLHTLLAVVRRYNRTL